MSSFQPTIHPWNQELWQHLTDEPERSNHALLFAGHAGLGKIDLAFSLAHFIVSSSDAQSSTLFDAGSHPDLHILLPEERVPESLMGQYATRYVESHTGKPKRVITIDQVRMLNSALSTHPHIAATRVIMIGAAEAMNRNAANALLKSLEEPPQNTLFILVCDELSKLPKTIRSRCSVVPFRTPSSQSAGAWLKQQGQIPSDQIDTYLSLAGNHPLLALDYFNTGYLDNLKSIFTDVNNIWSRQAEVTQVAKSWQDIGAQTVVDTLQKLVADLVKSQLTQSASNVFFPVQNQWVRKSGAKIDRTRLLASVDALNEAKTMLSTTVDPLLVLEQACIQIHGLPR